MSCAPSSPDMTDLIRIVVALLVAGSFFINVYLLYDRIRGRRWQEYQDTVYDPLMRALADIERTAAMLSGMAKVNNRTADSAPEDRIKSEVATGVNQVQVVCARASRHSASIKRDWTERADSKGDEIYRSLEDYNLACSNDCETLASQLIEFCQCFYDRLSRQREAMR